MNTPEPADHAILLARFSNVLVHVGVNLQPGQRLLITDPYELQGICPETEALARSVESVAECPVEIVRSSPERVRRLAEKKDWHGWTRLLADHTALLAEQVRRGDALLFLQGSHPDLLNGLPNETILEWRRLAWEYFGTVAQSLSTGQTNWTAAPAPNARWADAVYPERPASERLPALWQTVLASCRALDADPVESWHVHRQHLRKRQQALNAMAIHAVRYVGDRTDLTLALPPEHRWCTANLTTPTGIPFVANLPTEEIFTVPDRHSANGTVRVARPIHYAGAMIEGIEFQFRAGRVFAASATNHPELLAQLLAVDDGAVHLGEVAIVPDAPDYAHDGRFFHHPLLDENACAHIALGEAYASCLRRPNSTAFNRSLIHVDLALNAQVFLNGKEPA